MLLVLLIVPLLAAALSFFAVRDIRALCMIALAAAALLCASGVALAASVAARGAYAATSYFFVDALGALIIMIVSIVGAAALWHSTSYLAAEVEKGIIGMRRVRQYLALLHLFLFAMLFASATANPILMWIAIEATTLATAFLISFYNKPSALEAAWKYLILNSVGLLLGFFGTLLISARAIGLSDSILDWQALLSSAPLIDPLIAKIAFIFILVGYGTKVGLVPMHTWLPDAHSKAPAPVSGLLSGVLLNVAFLAIVRFKVVADAAAGPEFSASLLMMFGLISIIVAALLIFGQKNYKRLLAYSSIEHMGIATFGFSFGGAGAAAALLHMLYHAIGKSLLFLSAGNIFLRYSSTKIADVRGMLRILPGTAILFVIGFLAITAIPPFGTFYTEYAILAAGIHAYLLYSVLASLGLALAFAGFLRHVAAMLFGTVEATQEEQRFVWRENAAALAPIVALAVLLSGLSVFIPGILQTIITVAAAAY